MPDIIQSINISQLIVILGLLLVLMELFIGIEMGFDFVIVGSALILGGFAGILTGSTLIALLASSVLFIAYIFFGRKYVKQKINVFADNNMNIDKLINQEALVTTAITPTKAGIVKLNEEEWRAVSKSSFKKDDIVLVQSIDGVTLSVVKKPK